MFHTHIEADTGFVHLRMKMQHQFRLGGAKVVIRPTVRQSREVSRVRSVAKENCIVNHNITGST